MRKFTVRAAQLAVTVVLLALLAAGCGLSESSAPARSEQYRAFLEEKAALLVRALQAMQAELEQGDLGRAASRYVRARVRYSQVEPVAEMLPALDAAINAHEEDIPADQFGGFHRIERALSKEESTAGMAPVGKQLIEDAKQLQRRLQTIELPADRIVAGAEDILAEIAGPKLAGKEEPYSGVFMVDISANVEAVGAAIFALRPAMDKNQWTEASRRLLNAYRAVEEWGIPARSPYQPRDRSPGISFLGFGYRFNNARLEELRQSIEALSEAIAEIET